MIYRGFQIDFALPTSETLDLSTASSLYLNWDKPTGTTVQVSGSYSGDNNEIFTASVTAVQNDEIGPHQAQAFAVISGVTYPGPKIDVYVDEPISDP